MPVMAEANLRALRPWRAYLPLLPAFWQFRACTARLDAYIKGRLRSRWKARHDARPAGHKPDIVDRLFAAIEARVALPPVLGRAHWRREDDRTEWLIKAYCAPLGMADVASGIHAAMLS